MCRLLFLSLFICAGGAVNAKEVSAAEAVTVGLAEAGNGIIPTNNFEMEPFDLSRIDPQQMPFMYRRTISIRIGFSDEMSYSDCRSDSHVFIADQDPQADGFFCYALLCKNDVGKTG